MQRFAEIRDGSVINIIEIDHGHDISEMYHSEYLSALVECGEDVGIGSTYDGEAFGAQPTRPIFSADDLMRHASMIRWQRQTSGTTVSGGVLDGTPVPTDETTIQFLTAAMVRAASDSSYVIPNWKLSHGQYVTLDANAIAALSKAAEQHVQTCFDANKLVDVDISNGLITTIEEVEVSAHWP